MSRQEERVIQLLEEIRDAVVDSSESDESFNCGYNGCGRTVDSPEDRCWQHQDEE